MTDTMGEATEILVTHVAANRFDIPYYGMNVSHVGAAILTCSQKCGIFHVRKGVPHSIVDRIAVTSSVGQEAKVAR